MFLGANELTNKEKGYIQKFRNKAAQFWAQWNTLDDMYPTVSRQSPAIRNEYQSLMDRGSTIRSTVETISGAIDRAAKVYESVRDWVSSTFGLNGNDINNKVNELGVIPLIPIALIIGSLAAMSKWVSDAYEFNERLKEIRRLEATGLSPAEAAAIVERTMDKGFFGGAGNLVPIALLGVAALMMLKGKG